MIIYLLVTALLLVLVHIVCNCNEKARIIKTIPGPELVFIFGNALQIILSPVEIMAHFKRCCEQYKGINSYWSFFVGFINIYNPEDIETVLSGVKNNDKSVIYRFLKPWLREGLLVSQGEKWHQRRKLLTPAFHFKILRQYFTILQAHTQRLIEKIETIAGEPVDVLPLVSEYTLNTICETAMGTRLNNETSEEAINYKLAIYDLGKLLVHRILRFYLFLDFCFKLSITGMRMKKHLNTIHKFTENVILDRKEYFNKYGTNAIERHSEENDVYSSGRKRNLSMLDLLLLEEKHGHIDTLGIQEEVDTFMFEGHDTTASGLTFCLMLLANKKDIQDKIFTELNEIFGDSTRAATIEDLSKMKYLECCIKESLRLYPPVHFIGRHITEPVQLSGYTVPANTMCNIHIMALHRSPHVYKDPLTFDPDRFLPENSVGRHPYAYIPFSAGPRNCIGQKFAMMEMKLAVAAVLRQFSLQPVTRHDHIQFTADLVLRHVGPVLVTFVKRSKQ